MKIEFNEEIESLKKNQNEIKLEMKNSRSQAKSTEENVANIVKEM